MRVTDLGGHSGCKILLCEEGNGAYVRKKSGSLEYNARLQNQAKKQADFNNMLIKAPRIIDTGYDEKGLFYFDMEYVQGITLAEYIKTIEIGKIRNLVTSIVTNIVDLGKETYSDSQCFINKIRSLKKILSAHDNAIVNAAIEMLEKHSWDKFYQTACHGDLTLENIIIKDNQIYLIDFLDSFYDSWIMDVSTLMQDVQTMWSYRKEEPDINAIIRLMIFRDILLDEVKDIAGDTYIEVYYALLLKLVRIFPYTKDEDTYLFLNKKVESVMEIIKMEEEQ